jgi:hypothetical protein
MTKMCFALIKKSALTKHKAKLSEGLLFNKLVVRVIQKELTSSGGRLNQISQDFLLFLWRSVGNTSPAAGKPKNVKEQPDKLRSAASQTPKYNRKPHSLTKRRDRDEQPQIVKLNSHHNRSGGSCVRDREGRDRAA